MNLASGRGTSEDVVGGRLMLMLLSQAL